MQICGYYDIVRDYIGIMEKKMEATIYYRGGYMGYSQNYGPLRVALIDL